MVTWPIASSIFYLNSELEETHIWFGTQRLAKLVDLRGTHDVDADVVRHAYLST